MRSSQGKVTIYGQDVSRSVKNVHLHHDAGSPPVLVVEFYGAYVITLSDKGSDYAISRDLCELDYCIRNEPHDHAAYLKELESDE